MGKLINSTIVHQLILEKKLSFDDKLSQWFPDIQNANNITIEQLLTHTNGIYSFNYDPDLHDSNESFSPLELQTLRAFSKDDPNLALAHNNGLAIEKDYSSLLGAGGFVSNSKDMATFLSALLTGKIIPIKKVHAMMKNLYPMFDKGHYYGRGIMLYDFSEIDETKSVWIGHSGGTQNYKAILLYDTQSKVIMAVCI